MMNSHSQNEKQHAGINNFFPMLYLYVLIIHAGQNVSPTRASGKIASMRNNNELVILCSSHSTSHYIFAQFGPTQFDDDHFQPLAPVCIWHCGSVN